VNLAIFLQSTVKTILTFTASIRETEHVAGLLSANPYETA